MTLSTTELYDDWIDVLTDSGFDEETAVGLTETIFADPRVVHAAPEDAETTRELIGRLDDLLIEARLDQFDPVTSPESLRDRLRDVTQERLLKPVTAVGVNNDEIEEEPTFTPDISNTEHNPQPALGAGMEGGVEGPGGDGLGGGGIGGDGPPDPDTESTTQPAGDTDTDESGEEYPLETVLVNDLINVRRDALQEALEIDLSDVDRTLFRYSVRTVRAYETLLREELFPNHPEHEAKVLYEQLIRDSLREEILGTRDEAVENDESDEATDEADEATDRPENQNDGAEGSGEQEDGGEVPEGDGKDEPEEPSLALIAAYQTLEVDEDAIESDLDVPLEFVNEVFVGFAAEAASVYRRFVADVLFAGVPTEHRSELLTAHLEDPARDRFQTDADGSESS